MIVAVRNAVSLTSCVSLDGQRRTMNFTGIAAGIGKRFSNGISEIRSRIIFDNCGAEHLKHR